VIDLRAARAEPDRLRPGIARKGGAEAFDELLAADEQRRELIPRVDELRSRQKLKGKPTPEQVEELKQVKVDLRTLEEQLGVADERVDELLRKVPNPAHESVPDEVTDEAEGDVVRIVGEPPRIEHPKDHLELGRFEMERAARLSGSRFGYIVGDTARLALALYRWALDRVVAEGFTPVLPPVLVREEAMYGTGFFPAERFEIYEVADEGLYLTGTSEVALAGLHMGEILERDELPLRYTAFSTNFRREAGAAGRDTRGMFRVHQFNKVELFAYVLPEESWDEHERLLAIEESLAQELGLPYRVVNIEASELSAADRLPVAPARHPLPRERAHGVRAHAERHRGHRPLGARRARELPGRGARGAAAVRRAGADQRFRLIFQPWAPRPASRQSGCSSGSVARAASAVSR
jgi:seryl-tRNA synthetase